MTQCAALLFVLVSLFVAIFQAALTLGAPWGEFTLGGRWRGRLPLRVRPLPLLSIALLVAFAAVILSRANIALAPLQNHSRSLSWVVVGYCVLATIANAATPSKRQRNLWLPVVVLMLLLSLVVALS